MEEKDMPDLPNLEDAGKSFNVNTESSEEDSLNLELTKLHLQLDEQKDKYLRLVADYDNFRKRTAKERLELIQTAGKDVIGSLLTVLDDSERAEKQLQSGGDVNDAKEGITLVFNKLRSTLQARGLKPMESLGADFNADIHEAITEIPAPSPDAIGKVVAEVEKGYFLNDKIIRFAKVVVGK